MTALGPILLVSLIYITSSSHFIRIYITNVYHCVVNTLSTTPGSILAKLPWLVAATFYHFPCPLWLSQYQCLDRRLDNVPLLPRHYTFYGAICN